MEEKKTKKNNNNKIIIGVAILMFLLGIVYILPDPNAVESDLEKKDFAIQTKTLSEFNNDIQIEKPGILSSDKEISVLSKASGKISQINYKEWDYVKTSNMILSMTDSNNQYYNVVRKLENWVESAQLQYEQSIINFDKNIHDAQIALDKAEDDLEQYIKTAEIQLKELENSQNSQNNNNSLNIAFISQYNSLNSFLNNTLLELDFIFGVSDVNEKLNDQFEYLISAKNVSYRTSAESLIRKLFNTQKNLQTYNTDKNTLTYQEIETYLIEMKQIYSDLEELLNNARLAFVYSVPDADKFPQQQIDWYIALAEQLQSNRNNLEAWFNQYENQFNSSISIDSDWNYINIGDDTVNLNYEKAIINIETQLNNLERAVQISQSNLDNLIKQRENTLEMSKNSIEDVKISYSDAVSNASKLTVYAPINWNIGSVYIQEWQDVNIWTSLFTIIDQDKSQIRIWVNSIEHTITQAWDTVDVVYKWETIPWIIDSVSPVALAWWQYTVTIKVSDDIDLVWDVASVIMYWTWEYTNLPLNIVKVLSDNEWYIFIYNQTENSVDITPVQFGKVWWDHIELISDIPSNSQIITNTNIEEYNKQIHTIVSE